MKQQKVENQHQQDQNYYLQKIFSLKQKTNQILSATLEKIKYCPFKKKSPWFLSKTKTIQADVDIFIHIPAYSDILKYKHAYSQVYSELSIIPVY